MKASKIFLSIVIIFLFANGFARQWTEPVQISTREGYNRYPDFCIDNDGTIHCVWSYEILQFHRIIYYSKSTDGGQTWIEPEDISQNDSMWMEDPHILSDSKNNLHVFYDHRVGSINPNIVHRYFDGQNWSDLDTVSFGCAGARDNRPAIDNEDKLFCFWFLGNSYGNAYFRVLENGQWGGIIEVYDSSNSFFIERAIVDSANVVHCAGYHHYVWQSPLDHTATYTTCNNLHWSELTKVSSGYGVWVGIDIALDNYGYPHLAWRQSLDDGAPPENGTNYSCFDGINWREPQLIAKNANAQAIIIDNCNSVHILDNEEMENDYRLMHYQLTEGQWIGELLDSSIYGIYYNKLINHDGFLYLINGKADTIINTKVFSSIFFRKYAITTAVEEGKLQAFDSFRLYPNPSRGSTTIDYTLKEEAPILIEVYGLNGKMIDKILDKRQTAGRYQIKWNGTDKNRKEVKNGLYLIRLQAGRYFTARPVEIVR